MSQLEIKEIMEGCVEEVKEENVVEIKQEDPLQDDHPVQEHMMENNDKEEVLKFKDDIDIDDQGILCDLKQEKNIDLNNCYGRFEETEGLDNINNNPIEAQLPKNDKNEPSDEKDEKYEASLVFKGEEYETPLEIQFSEDELSEENCSEDEATKVVCSKCPKKLRNKQCLKSHMYDAHSGPRYCDPCQRSFKLRSQFSRHNREVHMKIPSAVCSNCGKTFTRNDYLRLHEAKCLDKGNGYIKRSTEKLFDCQYCPKKYCSKSGKVFHEKKFHKDGSLIVTENKKEEFICKVCKIPRRFIKKCSLKTHMIRIHDGRNDIIKVPFYNKVIKLSENEVRNQKSKKADCEFCSEGFSCEQDLQDHMKTVHHENRFHKCKQCPKRYRKQHYLKDHERNVHIDAKFVCPECGLKSKLKQNLLKHMEIHSKEKPDRQRKPISSLKKSQKYRRLKEEANQDLNKSEIYKT